MSRKSAPPLPEMETEETTAVRRLPPYHVIIENDDVHTCEFVIDVLRKVLPCDEHKAFKLMLTAHETGRAVVWTGSKEVGELKVEQIRSFHEILAGGRAIGPLGVLLEPAPG